MDTNIIEGMPSDLAEIIAAHKALFGGFVMVDAADAADADGDANGDDSDDGDDADQKDETDWKALSRRNERRARAAEKKLQAAQAASGTPDEQVARETSRADAAEALLARREVAIEYGLNKADSKLLDDVTDEDAMHRIAKRLKSTAAKKQRDADDEDEDDDEDEAPKPRTTRRTKPRDGLGGSSEDLINRRTAAAVFGGGR